MVCISEDIVISGDGEGVSEGGGRTRCLDTIPWSDNEYIWTGWKTVTHHCCRTGWITSHTIPDDKGRPDLLIVDVPPVCHRHLPGLWRLGERRVPTHHPVW